MTGCYLFSHKVKLPEWGFEQQEVSWIAFWLVCELTGRSRAIRIRLGRTRCGTSRRTLILNVSFWSLKVFSSRIVPFDAEKVNYSKPSFLTKFLELQGVMWRTNAGLTERHAYDSRPQHWFWMRRGIVSSPVLADDHS